MENNTMTRYVLEDLVLLDDKVKNEETQVGQELRPSEQHLDRDAHGRWRASFSRKLLSIVDCVEIQDTRVEPDGAVFYVLQIYSRQSTFLVERRFSDFIELRNNVHSALRTMPQCLCRYCAEFLLYIRYKMSQPRSITKLTTGTEARKKMLSQFINDFVTMGKRRVRQTGKYECKGQVLVPPVLEEFLYE